MIPPDAARRRKSVSFSARLADFRRRNLPLADRPFVSVYGLCGGGPFMSTPRQLLVH